MLATIRASQSTTWLLQKFVASPLLFRQRKFHLRVIALACGDLRVHVHRHIVVIPAFSSYEDIVKDIVKGDGDAVKVDKFAFLTNHCVQSSHADYQAGRFAMLIDLCRDVFASGHAPPSCSGPEALCELLFERISHVIGEVFAASKLSPTSFFPLPHCFELFGCDMMIDQSLNVWILEINSDPSMTLYEGPNIEDKVVDILSDTLDAFLGPSASNVSGGEEGGGGGGGTLSWQEYWGRSESTSVYIQGIPFYPSTLTSATLSSPAALPNQTQQLQVTRHQVPHTATQGSSTHNRNSAPEPEVGRGAGGGGGGGGGGAGGGGPQRFPCVYSRAPRYEGLAGLKVMRGLLKRA
jgi:hypothetical protein